MNYSAEICRIVVDGEHSDVDAIRDQVGMSTKTFDILVSKLCGEGVLRRKGDRLEVHNQARARLAAEQALKIAAAEPVRTTVPDRDTKPKRQPPLAIPAVPIEIRSNVPLPPPRIGRLGRPPSWLFIHFAKMAVGQSLSLPVPDDETPPRVAEFLRKEATAYRRIAPNFRVAVRIEEGDKSVGLWREPDDGATPVDGAATTSAAPGSLGIRARKSKKSTALSAA